MIPEVNSPRWLSLRNLENEIWRPLLRLGNGRSFYVSNLGRVKIAFSKASPRILKQFPSPRYLKVQVGGRMEQVHQLVAAAFLVNDSPETRTEIDHRDGQKHNNAVSNLRWATRRENMNNPVTRWEHARRYGHSVGERPEPTVGEGISDREYASERIWEYFKSRYKGDDSVVLRRGIDGVAHLCFKDGLVPCRSKRKTPTEQEVLPLLPFRT